MYENDLIEQGGGDRGIVVIASTQNHGQTKILFTTDMTLSQAIGFRVRHVRIVEDKESLMRSLDEVFTVHRRQENGCLYDLDYSEVIERVDQLIDDSQSFTYQGVRYRTRQIARWAAFFQYLNIPYDYVRKAISLDLHGSYQPDFWLPQQNAWMIVRKNLLNHMPDRIIASVFVQQTETVLYAFNECQQTVYHNTPEFSISHTGQFLKPLGEWDGRQEFGHCTRCDNFCIGYDGIHDSCPSVDKTHVESKNNQIAKAFKQVNLMIH